MFIDKIQKFMKKKLCNFMFLVIIIYKYKTFLIIKVSFFTQLSAH